MPVITDMEDTAPRGEDAAPVDMLSALFEARGWAFDALSDEEMSGEIQGAWTKYQMRAIWRSEDNVLQLLCMPEIRVSDARMRAAHELLALVNEQVWLGHFDVWSAGGIVAYRHATMLGDDGLLSVGQAQALVETAVSECDRFYPAFQFVLWGDKTPQEALQSAMIDAMGEA